MDMEFINTGELAVIVAPIASGKTTKLITIGTEALRSGMYVMHITLDNSETHIRSLYPDMYELTVKEFATHSISAIDVFDYINAIGISGSLVILDCVDLLQNMWPEITDIADTYKALHQIAKDTQCRLYTASNVGPVYKEAVLIKVGA